MSLTRFHLLEKPEAFEHGVLGPLLSDGVTLTQGSEVPAGTQVLIGGRPTREQLAAPELRALIVPWVGMPEKTRDLLREFPHVAVHNLHHNAPMVAELAVGLLLAAAKFIVPLDRGLRSHDWRPRTEAARSLLLSQKTCLILGYGAIGQRVARICRAFDMTVIAIRSRSQQQDGVAHEIHAPAALPELLPRAQAVVVCLPLTPETEGILGRDELSLLPSDAVLVNVGRGRVVDEEALHTALLERRIAGAGLDVWYNYPSDEKTLSATPPSDYPFWDLDNVVLSPHRGGGVAETEELRARALADVIAAAAAGQPIPNPVDLERGY